MPDGQEIAVKRLARGSKQGLGELNVTTTADTVREAVQDQATGPRRSSLALVGPI